MKSWNTNYCYFYHWIHYPSTHEYFSQFFHLGSFVLLIITLLVSNNPSLWAVSHFSILSFNGHTLQLSIVILFTIVSKNLFLFTLFIVLSHTTQSNIGIAFIPFIFLSNIASSSVLFCFLFLSSASI